MHLKFIGRRILTVLFIVAILLVLMTDPLYAYVDPGRNSVLHNLIFGGLKGVFAACVLLGKHVARRVRSRIDRLLGKGERR